MHVISVFECDSFGGLACIHYANSIRKSIYLAINFHFRWRNKMLSYIRWKVLLDITYWYCVDVDANAWTRDMGSVETLTPKWSVKQRLSQVYRLKWHTFEFYLYKPERFTWNSELWWLKYWIFVRTLLFIDAPAGTWKAKILYSR